MNSLFIFDTNISIILCIGFLFVIASILSFEIIEKHRLSLFLLFIAGIFLCSAMAMLDPFLNIWDEQFHALVSKNLLSNPFKPSLFKTPLIPFDPHNWIGNHIWLHKQPLFLWQMAISLKLFGINEFAVRLPSVLMMSILPLLIFRIGKISLNQRIGFYGSLLFCTAFYVHEMLTGFPPSDHNDIAFLFYVTCSIWAWIEYEKSQKKYWLILIGVFSGFAVLTKWLTGLLVFSGWSLSILLDKKRKADFKNYKNIFLSFFISLLTFVPWQIYTTIHFPIESKYEYSLNTRHFFEVIENHGGNAFYYINNLKDTYGGGDLVPFLILLSLFFLYKSLNENRFKIGIFSFIIITYAFFTIAATKMQGFCYIVSPLIFLSLAAFLDSIFTYFKNKFSLKIPIGILVLIVFAWLNFDLHQIAYKHTMKIRPDDNDKRIEKINDATFIKSLKSILPTDDYAIFNCKKNKNIAIMFYTNNVAYDQQLDYDNYLQLKNKKIKLAVIDDYKLPDYIKNDIEIIKITAPDSTWLGVK